MVKKVCWRMDVSCDGFSVSVAGDIVGRVGKFGADTWVYRSSRYPFWKGKYSSSNLAGAALVDEVGGACRAYAKTFAGVDFEFTYEQEGS